MFGTKSSCRVPQSLRSWTRPQEIRNLRSCSKQGQLRNQIRVSGFYSAKSWKSPEVETAQPLWAPCWWKDYAKSKHCSTHAYGFLSSHQTLTGPSELLLDQSLMFSQLNQPSSLLLRHVLQTIGHFGGCLPNLFWFIIVFTAVEWSILSVVQRAEYPLNLVIQTSS